MSSKRKGSPEIDWSKVFAIRCRNKRGEPMTDEEHALIYAAYVADPKKYGSMEKDVFNATVPFGSTARRTK